MINFVQNVAIVQTITNLYNIIHNTNTLTSNGLCINVIKSGLRSGMGGSLMRSRKFGFLIFSTSTQSAWMMPLQYL